MTTRENVLRGVGLPAENARRSICSRGHPLDDAYVYPGGRKRQCRICRQITQRRRRRVLRDKAPLHDHQAA